MEFVELTFSRHDTCNLLCDTSLALARFSPTRRYTGFIPFLTERSLRARPKAEQVHRQLAEIFHIERPDPTRP